MDLSKKQADQVLKEAIEEIFVDGIDGIIDYAHDEATNTLWGTFRAKQTDYDFEIDLDNGQLSY